MRWSGSWARGWRPPMPRPPAERRTDEHTYERTPMDATLPLLIERSRARRDALAAAAATAQRASQQADATLQRLQAFRQEYLARAPALRSGPQDADGVAGWQAFMASLDRALVQQGEACERSRQLQALRQRELAEGQQRLTAFEALATRQAQARLRRDLHNQQRETDAFAARAPGRPRPDDFLEPS